MADFLQRFLGGAKSAVSSVSTDIDSGADNNDCLTRFAY